MRSEKEEVKSNREVWRTQRAITGKTLGVLLNSVSSALLLSFPLLFLLAACGGEVPTPTAIVLDPNAGAKRLATVIASPTLIAGERPTARALATAAPAASPTPTVYVGVFLDADDVGSGNVPLFDPASLQRLPTLSPTATPQETD